MYPIQIQKQQKYRRNIKKSRTFVQESKTQSKTEQYTIPAFEIIKMLKLIHKNQDDFIVKTKLHMSKALSERYQCQIYLKRQDLQHGKTFKLRGSYSKFLNHSQQIKANGIVTASDGNFAQSLSIMAGKFKLKSILFVPEVCFKHKIQKMIKLGGDYIEIRKVGNSLQETLPQATKFAQENNMVFFHPYNDIDIITGYATIGPQILDQVKSPKIDYLMVPCGGGSLLAGLSSYFAQLSPKTKIICVQPQNAAVMKKSIKKNKLIKLDKTSRYCDGSSVNRVGQIPFDICKKLVQKYQTVEEGEIATAIVQLYKLGIISQPSGAIAYAVLQKYREQIKDKTVVCLITGGNTDLARLDQARNKSAIFQGKKKTFDIRFPNKTGIFKLFTKQCLGQNDYYCGIDFNKKPQEEFINATIQIQSNSQKEMRLIQSKIFQMGLQYEIKSSTHDNQSSSVLKFV